jgi:hypothetical protein
MSGKLGKHNETSGRGFVCGPDNKIGGKRKNAISRILVKNYLSNERAKLAKCDRFFKWTWPTLDFP